MVRIPIPPVVQADVVIKSKRRCALCFGLNGDTSERPGQIAHLNGDHADSRLENLVWLCLEHHDKFDSKTSQTKNYTQIEVRNYRDSLHRMYSLSEYSQEDIQLTRRYLNEYAQLFAYISNENEGLALQIHHRMWDCLAAIRDFWYTNELRSFNSNIQEIQDHIANNIVGILCIYEINMYDWSGEFIRFDKYHFPQSILKQKQEEVIGFVNAIVSYYRQLQVIATK
ncbi:MAG: hypothetical protein Q8K87_15335 [Hydrogenophaga sp.]|nr:hypothetical protein [Hydrogenophaga sp.]